MVPKRAEDPTNLEGAEVDGHAARFADNSVYSVYFFQIINMV